jgi:hypothetical protein
MAISHMESLTDETIASMSDITVTFDEVEYVQIEGLGVDIGWALSGGGAMTEELRAYNAAPWPYTSGLKGAVATGAFSTIIDEAKYEIPNAGGEALTGWDLLNPFDTVAEKEETLSEKMSITTYQTIQMLQDQLRTMIQEYNKECCPNQ